VSGFFVSLLLSFLFSLDEKILEKISRLEACDLINIGQKVRKKSNNVVDACRVNDYQGLIFPCFIFFLFWFLIKKEIPFLCLFLENCLIQI